MSRPNRDTIYFTCTPDQAASIRGAAQREGLTVASWVRRACMLALPRTCATCDTPLAVGARFCATCGTPVIAPEG